MLFSAEVIFSASFRLRQGDFLPIMELNIDMQLGSATENLLNKALMISGRIRRKSFVAH